VRKLAVAVFAALVAGASACGPKPVLAPIVTAPRFPDFIKPPVPPALAADVAAPGYDRAWRFLQAGDLRNADRELASALRLSPGFYPAEAAAGYVDLARKDPKSALDRFDRALAGDARSASALDGRGRALVALGREAEAVAAFDAAVAADPSLSDVRRQAEVMKFRLDERNLASARDLTRAGKFDEAARAYRDAIASSPDSPFLYRELGGVERQNGDMPAALESFRKALSLDPSDAASLAQIGDVLEATGDRAGALSAYDRSLAIERSDAVQAKRDALVADAELAKLPEQYRAIDARAQVTRADLAALIDIRLAPAVARLGVRDVSVITDVRNSWAEPWIVAVARAGVMEPFADHTFQPRTLVRRADLAQAVARLLDAVAAPARLDAWRAARGSFLDLPETHLAYPAVLMAVASGVMQAAEDGSFQPSRPVTGAEAVQAVDRLQAIAAGGQTVPRR
jgi:tetratricopeptide (TPR) repeat protein